MEMGPTKVLVKKQSKHKEEEYDYIPDSIPFAGGYSMGGISKGNGLAGIGTTPPVNTKPRKMSDLSGYSSRSP